MQAKKRQRLPLLYFCGELWYDTSIKSINPLQVNQR